MNTRNLQKIVCAGLVSGALLLNGVTSASVVTNRVPLLGYADHNISVYRVPGGMTSAVVAAETALIKITQVRADGWAYGTYPMSNGRRASGWFRMNDVQGNVNFNNVSGKILYQQTVYRTPSMGGSNGVLSQGASVLVIAEQGGLSQIIYKQSNSVNWRIGWVLTDAVQKEQPHVVQRNTAVNKITQTVNSSVNNNLLNQASQVSKNANQRSTAHKTVQQQTKIVEKSSSSNQITSAATNSSNKINQTLQNRNTIRNVVLQRAKPSTTAGKVANNNVITQSGGVQLSSTSSVNKQLGGSAVSNSVNGVVNRYGKVLQQAAAYPNENLTNQQNGEYAGAGDIVVILQASGNAYKITYPAKDRLKDRWVAKSNVAFYNGVNYQSWQGKMIKRADAHHAPTLNLHPVTPEYAENGDTVTVLDDAGNAYFVSYPLSNGNYKARWVAKSAVERINAVNRVVVPRPVINNNTNPIIKPVQRQNGTNGIKGDMNQDGRVDQTDLDIMKNIIVEKIPSNNVYKQVGDMNNDGEIDIIDLSQLVSLVHANTKSVNTTTNNQVSKSVTLANLKVVYPANGLYSIQPMCAPNTELTVQGASKNEGANVFIYSIASDWHKEPSHQKWYIERIGNTEWYKITAENSGHALNIHGGVSENGRNVSIWPYSASAKHHQFRFLDAGNGYYVIQGNISGNFVLDVNNAGAANETNVQIYNFNNSGAQKWKLVKRTAGKMKFNDIKEKLIYAIFNTVEGTEFLCDFDGYSAVGIKGRHEGIDVRLYDGAKVYSAIEGIITYGGGDKFNTFAIYDTTNNKTVVYLHFSKVASGLETGMYVSKGTLIGYQGKSGTNTSHVHIEVREGKKQKAAVSKGDKTLDNINPYPYWQKML